MIDTHAHVDQLEDFAGAMARAAEAGITDVVAMTVDRPSIAKTMELIGGKRSGPFPTIHLALGIHPGHAKPEELDENIAAIRTHIGQAKAVGETGLDYWYKWVRKDEVERKKQKDSFEAHLQIAKEFDKPIVIHARGAWRDCLAMTKAAGVRRANFHWYSGPVDILKEILDAGYFVSTSPSVGYSPQSREAMSFAPIERILVETDTPVYYRTSETEGYSSEPKDVLKTLEAYAALKGIEPEAAAEILNSNARAFFDLT